MEFLKKLSKTAAELADGQSYEFDFVLPADVSGWTVRTIPKKTTNGADCTVEILYGSNGTFRSVSGVATSTATAGKDLAISRTDGVAEIRVEVTLGTPKPDGGLEVLLYGTRRRA